MISLFFLLISKIEYSYGDYEHLLRTRKFMITETRHFDKVQIDDMSDIEGVDNSIDVEQEEIK